MYAGERARRRRLGLAIRLTIVVAMTLIPVTLALHKLEPPWRTDWFDVLHRTFEREPGDARDAVRIVALQRAPGGVRMQGIWPRDRIAEIVRIIGDGGARAIGLDVLLDGLGIFELIEAGQGVTGPRTDQLSAAMADYPVVAPVALFDDNGLERVPMLRKRGVGLSRSLREEASLQALDDAVNLLADAPRLTTALTVHPYLRARATAEGVIVDDIRAVSTLRDVPTVQLLFRGQIPDARYDSMAIQLIRAGLDLPEPELGPGWRSDVRLDLGANLSVPVRRDGGTRLYLRDKNPDLYLDGDVVLAGAVDPQVFRDKFVIVTTGFGNFAGRIDTPLFQNAMTGELIGQMVEQILDGRFQYRPTWLIWAESALFFVLATLFATFFGLRSSAQMLPIGLAITFSFIPISAGLFVTTGFLLDGLGLSMGLLIAGGFAMATYLIERDRRHQETQLALLTERAGRSRLDGELDVAQRIQMSLLPPGSATPVPSLELACHINPAQIVGGDFYDYVTRRDGKVFFSVGDVSGKGVPASLFMALSKSLWKSAALVRSDLAAVQEQANMDITRDNRDQMFVTGVVCLFDPQTMTLEYSGAGHDMPILARPGEAPRSLEPRGGPPMGLSGKLDFACGSVDVRPGDLICLFTDGLSEAELYQADPANKDAPLFFGVHGICDAMRLAASTHSDAATALGIVLQHLDDQTRGATQADDTTLVIARIG